MTLDLVAALAKLLLYAGALAGGGAALAWASLGDRLGGVQRDAPRRIAAGGLASVAAALAGGLLLWVRLGGELDGPTLSAVFGGPTGLALFARIGGGALLLATARGAARRPLRLAGAAALLGSFGVTGHSAAFSPWTGLLAAGHLAAAAWWFGGLLLLRRACRSLSGADLSALVRGFSRLALAVVGGLVASGSVLVLALVGPSLGAWSTPYARNLALKIAFAAVALWVANANRSRLVPRLSDGRPEAAPALYRRVTLELYLLTGALAATAWLTTFYSPHGGP